MNRHKTLARFDRLMAHLNSEDDELAHEFREELRVILEEYEELRPKITKGQEPDEYPYW